MKRVLSFIISLIFIFTLDACGNSDTVSTENSIIGATSQSPSASAIDEFLLSGASPVFYNTASETVLALENGKIDYAVLDEFELQDFLRSDSSIEISQKAKYSLSSYAYFSADNIELKEKFDSAIEKLHENGKIDSIKNSYLNKTASNTQKYDYSKALVMLCDPSFPNRIYTDDNGNIIGSEVDIAREICAELGYSLEIVSADFDELFLMLENGEGDFIMSAAELTDERTEQYLASQSYFTLNFYLVKRKSV